MAEQLTGEDRAAAAKLATSDAVQETARDITSRIAASFAITGTPTERENAARVLEELGAPVGDETTEPAAESTPEPPVAPAVQAAPLAFNESPEIEALLAEPEPEPEPEPEDDPALDVSAAVEEDELAFETERERELRLQLDKANKRADHERKQRVQASRSGWEAEALAAYGSCLDQADLAEIKADSHRDFIRKAKAKAEANRRVLERYGAAPKAAQAPTADEAALAAERQAKAEQWGSPTIDTPTSAPPETADAAAKFARARRSGNMAEIMRIKMFGA